VEDGFFLQLLKEIESRDIIIFLKDLLEKIIVLSFMAYGFKFVCCVVMEIIDFLVFKMINTKKNLPVFSANRNASGKCTKFYRIYGYSTVSDFW
jgi:hypothetical protein